MGKVRSLVQLSTLVVGTAAFSTSPAAVIAPTRSATSLSAVPVQDENNNEPTTTITITRALTSAAVSLAILTSPLHNTPLTNIAHADEWGIETEAPTLFTGETVMICKKRGPLGACLEQAMRTADNDNDKALKYFKDPGAEVKARQERMLQTMEDDSEGNALIQKLRKQSVENKEKNDQIVRTKTLMNDEGASFGPFSKQVVILNTDGKTFTLLQNPQAMRLKKAGYIEDRKFVIQPSKEVIDEALEGGDSLGDSIKGFFGGKEGEKEVTAAPAPVVEESVEITTDAVVEGESSAGEAATESTESN